MFVTGLHLVRSVGLRCLLLLGRKGILRRPANTGRGSATEALLISRGPSSTANARCWLLFFLFYRRR